MWNADTIASVLAAALADAEGALVVEQAPLGLDALAETALHPILADGCTAAGHTTLRERPYPGAFRGRPLPRERERCDLVLLPEGKTRLADPLALFRDADARAGTLFSAAPAPGEESAAAPGDAFWLEVKVVAQFAYTDGVPGPNRAYGPLLTGGPARDLAKLAREEMVESGGVAVLVFGADAGGLSGDLAVMASALLDRDLPISSPATALVPIADRAGNRWIAVCVVPLRAVR